MARIFPSSLNLILQVLDGKQKAQFAITVALAMVNGLLDLAGIVLLYYVMLSVVTPEDFGNLPIEKLPIDISSVDHIIVYAMLGLFLLFLVKNGIALLLSRLQIKTAFSINRELSDQMIHHHIWADAMTHHNIPSSKAINQLSTVSLYLADTLLMAGITLLSEGFIAIMILALTAFVAPQVFLYLVVTIVPTVALIMWSNRRRLKRFGDENNEQIPRFYGLISDSILGYEEIRLANMEKRFQEKMKRNRDKIYSNRSRSIWISEHYHFRFIETALILSLLIISFVVLEDGSIKELAQVLALYAAIAFRLVPSVSRIVGSMNSFSSYSYIADMLSQGIKQRHINEQDQQDLKFEKDIAFNKLSFHYDEDTQILNELDLSIHKGECIGIKGRSGAGKTTLANLLMGFYLPSSGSIQVDGNVLGQHNIIAWQKRIALVRQNGFLTSGTIAENVAFGLDHAEIDLQWVHTCLEKVGLWDWVDSLPQKLQTSVGELGNAISGGQRQRIVVARALYKEADLFIFDEPTTALDSEAKDEVISSISMLKGQGNTVLLISHDDDVLKIAERLFVLEKGQFDERKI